MADDKIFLVASQDVRSISCDMSATPALKWTQIPALAENPEGLLQRYIFRMALDQLTELT